MTLNKSLDNLCFECTVQGQCCYSAIKKSTGEVVGLKTLPCKYLTKSNSCSVYENRFEKVKECLSIEKAILTKALPDECLYVKHLENYKGKQSVSLEQESELLKSIVKKANPDDLPDFMSDDFKDIIRKYHRR